MKKSIINKGVTESVLVNMGFKNVGKMFFKGGMSLHLNRGSTWLASYKREKTSTDIRSVIQLQEFMESKNIK